MACRCILLCWLPQQFQLRQLWQLEWGFQLKLGEGKLIQRNRLKPERFSRLCCTSTI